MLETMLALRLLDDMTWKMSTKEDSEERLGGQTRRKGC